MAMALQSAQHETGALPATPDFDHYPIAQAVAVAVVPQPEGIVVTWADGQVDHFNRFWLRENEVADGIVNPVTRERDIDVAALPEDLAATAVAIEDSGTIAVTWHPDQRVTHHHPGWLRAFADRTRHPRAALPEQTTWDAASMAEPISFGGPRVLNDDGALRDWLIAVHRYGLARLGGLPDRIGLVQQVAERIGTIRPSSFGFLFDVESKPKPDSNAYTAGGLTPHTDLPSREMQPGIQLLHCRTNTCADGFSVMVDGFRVAEHIRATDPEAFAALTDLRWLFCNRHRDYDYRWSGPMVECDVDGRITEIRASNAIRAHPDMPGEDMPRAYRAVRKFMNLLASDSFRCRYPFSAGNLVAFDNRRILHGRDPFDARQGWRRLQGCYLDHDELYSRLRILAWREREISATAPPPT
ncbi:MAG: TauD/TfdA family dioxygenase [Pseudomonadota bacterium]